ncbi:DUF3775 domain-containing protein [Azospirillum sp. INR13]|uniref:DUF3775 domain-containing protein n=1 Tax=Azospirillum sp. INR13 TaxID=2596919 RepID=UPI001892728F|nr:DUF3775 domain-containing protein [Azospirillum sp. INR13]MBF5093869.1 DUF3775 domain-containing protein [Azospirillum sp. INR13]
MAKAAPPVPTPSPEPPSSEQVPELNIGLQKLCYLIVKAREFDAKVAPSDLDDGSNPSDDGMRAVLEDYADDPTRAELKDAIDGLDDDEVIDVIALVWLGRGDFSANEWADAQALAQERHTARSAEYLIGIPNLGDCLEEGAAQLGYSCEEFEIGRL